MYEHIIPQNVMDYEFKLFAGLSLKQFIIVVIACIISFITYNLNKNEILPSLFAWILIPTFLGFGVLFGLVQYQKISMDQWLVYYLRAVNSPLRRVWKKDAEPVKSDRFFNTKPEFMPSYLGLYFLDQNSFNILMKGTLEQSNLQLQPSIQELRIQPQQQVAQGGTPNPNQKALGVGHLTQDLIMLTSQTAAKYSDPNVTLPNVPNTLALRVVGKDGVNKQGVIAYLKDSIGNVKHALKSNASGIIYFNIPQADGNYVISFDDPSEEYPTLNIVYNGTVYPLIIIRSIT